MINETNNKLKGEHITAIEITSYPIAIDKMIHVKNIEDFIKLYRDHNNPEVYHLHYVYDDGEETYIEYNYYITKLTNDQIIVFKEE